MNDRPNGYGQKNPHPPAWPNSPPQSPPQQPMWPPAPEGYKPLPARADLFGYVSLEPLGRWTVWLLVACLATDILQPGVSLLHLERSASEAVRLANGAFSGLNGLISVVTAVFFLMWIYRVVANLRALGANGISDSPGWAIATFFVPIISLYRPYQIVRDTWRASEPGLDLDADPRAWCARPSAAIVGWWWFWWIMQVVVVLGVFAVVYSLFWRHGTLAAEPPIADTVTTIVSIPLDVAKDITAIRLVMALTARQEEAAIQLTSSAGGR